MPELPICGHCGADAQVSGANGGVWRSTDNGAGAPAAPDDVTAPPAEASDYLLKLGGVDGESSEGAALMPEQPVCGHCGADAQVQAQTEQAAPQTQRRRAPNFSFSFGGVTIGSGGVSVAAGDIDGDSQGAQSRGERRSDSSRSQRRSR